MGIYTLWLMAGSLLAVLVGQSRRRHRRWRQVRAAEAMRWCETLLQLLMALQLHRGMANAFLNGDRSFEQRMLAQRTHIRQLIEELAELPGTPLQATSGFDRDAVRDWIGRWESLASKLEGYGAFESTTRHTALIATLLNWLRGMGESGLSLSIPSTGIPLEQLVQVFSDRLPVLAETLGQARAVGAGIAASGKVTAVGRVRLSYLANRIAGLADHLRSFAQTAARDDVRTPNGEPLLPCMQAVDEKVGALLTTLQEDIIACEETKVSAGHYFNRATEAINAVFALEAQLGRQFSLVRI